MAAKTTYNVNPDTSEMVPFVTLIATNHVRLIRCPADAIQLDRLVRIDNLSFNKTWLHFGLWNGYVEHLMIINGNLVLFNDLLTSNGGYYLLRSCQSIGSQCCEWWSLRFIFLLHCSSSVRCSSLWFLNLGCTNCSILGLSAAIGGLDCNGRTRFFLSILLHPWVTHDFFIIDIVFVLKVSYRLMRVEQGIRLIFLVRPPPTTDPVWSKAFSTSSRWSLKSTDIS